MRTNIKKFNQGLHKAFKSGKAKVAAGVAATVAAPMAFASGGGSLASAMLDAVSGIETDVRSILIVLVGVIGLFILYAMIKKARA